MTRSEGEVEVIRRLNEYARTNASEQREALVAEWRKHHPEAAKETSSYLKPLEQFQKRRDRKGQEVTERMPQQKRNSRSCARARAGSRAARISMRGSRPEWISELTRYDEAKCHSA